MDGWVDGLVDGRAVLRITIKNGKKGFGKKGPHLSCDLHKIGANQYRKFKSAPFFAKWMDG